MDISASQAGPAMKLERRLIDTRGEDAILFSLCSAERMQEGLKASPHFGPLRTGKRAPTLNRVKC